MIVSEDSAFWQHDGVDYQQLKESIETNLERMEFARGGSTITQQLAKNLYLSPSKNPIRKVRELLIARRLEAELSKQRILEIYLERRRVGQWHLRRRSGGADLLQQVGGWSSRPRSRRCSPARSSMRGLLDPGKPTARLRRRQELILRRMGAVTPPPVIAEPVSSPTPYRDPGPVAARCRHLSRRQTFCPAKSCLRSKPAGPPDGKPPGTPPDN